MAFFSVGFFGGAGARGAVTISGNYVTLDTEQTITATKEIASTGWFAFAQSGLDASFTTELRAYVNGPESEQGVCFRNTAHGFYIRMTENGHVAIDRALKHKSLVLHRTATGQEDAADTGSTVTNKGATAGIVLTLPAAAAGLSFEFVREADFGLSIVPDTSEIVREGATNVTAAGQISLNAVGSTITVRAIDGDTWIVTASNGSITSTAA